MAISKVDYSLYLVTDSTSALLGTRDLGEIVDKAIRGGVTIVQYRDKVSDTAVLVATAMKLLSVTRYHKIPLIINDRVDVALAVGCEGIHIGQDDLDLKTARRILGKDAIIGVSVSTVPEALAASRGGADYLGIGTVFATPTKTNSKNITGIVGCREILQVLQEEGSHIPTVSIGGINNTNLQRLLYQSSASTKSLDGVAIVSAIIAADDPKAAAEHLSKLVKDPSVFMTHTVMAKDVEIILQQIPEVIQAVNQNKPLSHNMTNSVVQNFAANVALSVGGSPIMTNIGDEAADLCKLGGSLVINTGTVTLEVLKHYTQSLQVYNQARRPVLFDPVGVGATAFRRSALKQLMESGYFDVIKGNEGEIKTISGSLAQQQGVDSGTSTLNPTEKAMLVRDLAMRERNIVVMTGAVDFVSDGLRTYSIANGHALLGTVTGSGCALGTVISLMLAVCRGDKLLAAVAGLLHYEIAAEIAAMRNDVQGPGTFLAAFLDELYNIRKLTSDGNTTWLNSAKVTAVL